MKFIDSVRRNEFPRMGVDFYVRSMGKLLKVVAFFDSKDEANDYMLKHDNAALVAEAQGIYFLAEKYDRGLTVEKES